MHQPNRTIQVWNPRQTVYFPNFNSLLVVGRVILAYFKTNLMPASVSLVKVQSPVSVCDYKELFVINLDFEI